MKLHLALTQIELQALVTLVAAADESGLGEKLPGLSPLVKTLAAFDGLQDPDASVSSLPWVIAAPPGPLAG